MGNGACVCETDILSNVVYYGLFVWDDVWQGLLAQAIW